MSTTPRSELLRKLLRLDPETGKLFWRERPVDMFAEGNLSSEVNCRRWNTKLSGKEAFTSTDRHGYRQGTILGKVYRVHRIIWCIVHGEWPPEDIDHINGIRDDNRLINLRAVSHAENQKNQKMQANNTSGVTGLHWLKQNQKWMAYIKVNGKQKHLGHFTDKAAAISARNAAEIEHGFHDNHGRHVA